MIVFYDRIKHQLHMALMDALGEAAASPEELYGHWSLPPDPKMGHLSFPCFPLGQLLRSAPAQVARQLAPKIPHKEFIEKVESTGPYLNFTLRMETVAPFLLAQIHNGSFFRGPFKSELPRTMIEYFQPNTHKAVHVGHLRNLCLGLAMVELHRYLGYSVITATYPGDSGTHVAKVLAYLQSEKPDPPSGDRGEWLGEVYAKASAAAVEPERLAAILRDIGQESGESFRLWQETREWSLEHIRKVCAWARVDFDHWYFESEVDAPSLALARKFYEEGKLIKDDGAIAIDLKEEGLGLCLLIKRDGNGLYATKDIELARRKFEDHGIERSIYIVDKRQSLHFRQVFKTLEKIGHAQAKNCYHLAYEFVELPRGGDQFPLRQYRLRPRPHHRNANGHQGKLPHSLS